MRKSNIIYNIKEVNKGNSITHLSVAAVKPRVDFLPLLDFRQSKGLPHCVIIRNPMVPTAHERHHGQVMAGIMKWSKGFPYRCNIYHEI